MSDHIIAIRNGEVTFIDQTKININDVEEIDTYFYNINLQKWYVVVNWRKIGTLTIHIPHEQVPPEYQLKADLFN